jgi:hypothetical protein
MSRAVGERRPADRAGDFEQSRDGKMLQKQPQRTWIVENRNV